MRHWTRWGAASVGVLVWFALLAVYPAFGLPARVARAMAGDSPPRRPTLDAFDFLRYHQNGRADQLPYWREGPMLVWIRRNVPAGETIATAAWVTPGQTFTGSYDYHGRVASLGAHPVPLGWAQHERMWRGEAGLKLTADAHAAVDRLYEAPTPGAMRAAARALGARWVLYGVLEHDLYAVRRGHGIGVLRNLSRAGRLAAAFPAGDPAIFLFDFGAPGPKMDAP